MKRAAKIVLIGVCFGLILLFLKISFRIDDAAFMHGYWIAAVAIVLGAVLINVCYNLIYFENCKCKLDTCTVEISSSERRA